ncbi:MAG: tyrosine-type recombinase/integrase, partial [Candidatus Brocadiae bacterium]|nr:tyrosine-type recombinase/integrase [Candidatus Brocadiia bacterium]
MMAGQGFWDSKIPTERVLHVVVQQAGARDAAILMLLYAEGLSVDEVSALELCDLSLEDQLLTVRAMGEGRRVHLSAAVLDTLRDWLNQRGKAPGPLFLAGSPEEARPLSASPIRAMVTRKSKWDGVVVKRHVDETGRIYCYDQNDRLCWDMTQRERGVLVEDLRRSASGLHVG